MSELSIQHLLETQTVAIRDVACRGTCRHKSAEKIAGKTVEVCCEECAQSLKEAHAATSGEKSARA